MVPKGGQRIDGPPEFRDQLNRRRRKVDCGVLSIDVFSAFQGILLSEAAKHYNFAWFQVYLREAVGGHLVCNALLAANMQETDWKTIKAVKSLNQKGFTLIELISVIVIMGVMASVAIQKYDLLSYNAGMTVLKSGIRELNTRETVAWSKMKLSDTGYSNDTVVYNAVDKNIGPEYSWDPAPNANGGGLHYRSQSMDLTRTSSTPTSPGYWE